MWGMHDRDRKTRRSTVNLKTVILAVELLACLAVILAAMPLMVA
jgi:hypothetical protein